MHQVVFVGLGQLVQDQQLMAHNLWANSCSLDSWAFMAVYWGN